MGFPDAENLYDGDSVNKTGVFRELLHLIHELDDDDDDDDEN